MVKPRLPKELICRVMAFSDRMTLLAWIEVSYWASVEARKLLAVDIYLPLMENKRVLDYDTMSQICIGDYSINSMESLVSLPFLLSSKRLKMARTVTISLHREWHDLLKNPNMLTNFVDKLCEFGQVLSPERYIAHTLKLDIPDGLDRQLVHKLLNGWSARLTMRLEIHTESPRLSISYNNNFVQDILNASANTEHFTYAPTVLFINSPYPFMQSILHGTIMQLRCVQHLKLGNIRLSRAQTNAFLSAVYLPNLLTIIITFPVPLEAMLTFVSHHRLLESVKVDMTMDTGSDHGATFDMNNLVILKAPYNMLRRLLPRIQSAPKLTVVIYRDTGEFDPAIMSMERDLYQMSRFSSSIAFIQLVVNVHNETRRRYIKLVYRGERVEPYFKKLKEVRVLRTFTDDVFIPLWFMVCTIVAV